MSRCDLDPDRTVVANVEVIRAFYINYNSLSVKLIDHLFFELSCT